MLKQLSNVQSVYVINFIEDHWDSFVSTIAESYDADDSEAEQIAKEITESLSSENKTRSQITGKKQDCFDGNGG